tara:strand:- start:395 stop:1144 length:750 start_codon:yes stop_codon:yes gene_type:complete
MANGTKRKSRADTQQGRGEIRPESAWDQFRRWFDTEIGPLKSIQNLVDPSSGSVFEPKTEGVARDIYRALIPTTPRGIAAEAVGGYVAGPVIGAGMRRAGRALDVPFDETKRRTLHTLAGKDTIDMQLKRKELLSPTHLPGHPVWPNRYQRLADKVDPRTGSLTGGMDAWGRAVKRNLETVSNPFGRTGDAPGLRTRGGVVGDIIEHGKVLARKIEEEALQETGGALKKDAPVDQEFLNKLLRRLGVDI